MANPAQTETAEFALMKLKDEIVLVEGKRIKNHYMKYLGIDALIIGAIASIVLGIECEPIRVDDYTGKKMTFFHDPDGLPLELHE